MKHKQCAKCVYRGRLNFLGGFCNYAAVTERTCIRTTDQGETIDTRGADPNDCMLFEKGKKRDGKRELSTVKFGGIYDRQ